ncbi:hypothetical protein FCJ61_30565 [Burkholderia metallica]|uniref:hypothetical protein n=1 Tax=Burkholderia metallica TaxID=488729 RepID=UPI00157A8CA0|nr:hypothetical protein [Burkholderia metallica]NTZ87213.1 hypothetical protein [Burkholderia metallica]
MLLRSGTLVRRQIRVVRGGLCCVGFRRAIRHECPRLTDLSSYPKDLAGSTEAGGRRPNWLDRRIKCRGRIRNHTVAFFALLPEVPTHALWHIQRAGDGSPKRDLVVPHLE